VAGLVLLPSIWPLGLLLVALGVGMVRIPRLVTAAARRATFESKLWTGRRRVRVNCYAAISTVCVLTGLLLMVLYGAGAVLTSPVYYYNIRFFFVCAVLLTVGALIRRHARRLAALDADEVLRRDSRPMVLYLRTFADDSLTIRTAPYARQSFADRLSPRRFERFEEVLVRNLTEAGPVVALNPPRHRPCANWRSTRDADCRSLAIHHHRMDDRCTAHCCWGRPRDHLARIRMGATRGRLPPAVVQNTACSPAGT
jgi:hypothetical protein